MIDFEIGSNWVKGESEPAGRKEDIDGEQRH